MAAEIHCVYKLGGFIWVDLKGVSTAVMNELSLEFVSAFTIAMFPFWVVMPSTSAEIERVMDVCWLAGRAVGTTELAYVPVVAGWLYGCGWLAER